MNERHRARFGDAFFENLPVLGFLVVEQRVHIDRFVILADAGIDADLPEERFHTERARLIGHNRNDKLALFRIAQQLGQQPHKHHRGGNFATVGALVELLEMSVREGLQRSGAFLALRHVAAQLLAARLHVLDLGAVVGGPIERRLMQFVIGNRNAEARAEQLATRLRSASSAGG